MKVLRVQTEDLDYPLSTISTLLLCPSSGADVVKWSEWACRELLPRVRRRRLATFIDLACDPALIPVPTAMRIVSKALELGLKIKVHADFCSTFSPAQLALEIGAVSVTNLRSVIAEEINLLAASSCIAVLTPGIDLQTGLTHATPKRHLLDAGVIPAIGSNYHAELSPGYNMQLILLLACRLYGFRPRRSDNFCHHQQCPRTLPGQPSRNARTRQTGRYPDS